MTVVVNALKEKEAYGSQGKDLLAQSSSFLLQQYGGASKEIKQELVLFCCLKKCYKEENHKLALAFRPTDAGKTRREFIVASFEELSYEQRYGRAPPLHQERALQQFLDDMARS